MWRVVRFESIESIRQYLQPPLVATCGRVDFNRDGSKGVDSTTFSTTLGSYLRNIFQVQIDFRYAFPSNERWFIRFPINHESTSSRTIRKLPLTNRSGLGVFENPLAACRYLLSQTYTPEPDTKQRNSKECCVPTGSQVHAKATTFSENNGKRRR